MAAEMGETVPDRKVGRPSRKAAAAIPRRIIATATDLFLRNGFEKTSMDTVAAESGISKRTVYARFSSKADLFEAVIMELGDRKLEELAAVEVAGGSPAQRLFDLARKLLDIMVEPQVIALERIIASEAQQFPELAHRLYQEAGERVTTITANLLRQLEAYDGRSEEELRRDAQVLFGLIVLPPLRRSMLGNDDFPAIDHDLLKRSIEIFVAGALGEDIGKTVALDARAVLPA
ncbi:MAG: TetR/AcrR family transcriptional regulator [Mesorhizobium sp.]|nr:TetR/AcrR family transcriptional regulator [Mesorhizobium sp.]